MLFPMSAGGKCFKQLPVISINATRFSDKVSHAILGERACKKKKCYHMHIQCPLSIFRSGPGGLWCQDIKFLSASKV